MKITIPGPETPGTPGIGTPNSPQYGPPSDYESPSSFQYNPSSPQYSPSSPQYSPTKRYEPTPISDAEMAETEKVLRVFMDLGFKVCRDDRKVGRKCVCLDGPGNEKRYTWDLCVEFLGGNAYVKVESCHNPLGWLRVYFPEKADTFRGCYGEIDLGRISVRRVPQIFGDLVAVMKGEKKIKIPKNSGIVDLSERSNCQGEMDLYGGSGVTTYYGEQFQSDVMAILTVKKTKKRGIQLQVNLDAGRLGRMFKLGENEVLSLVPTVKIKKSDKMRKGRSLPKITY